MTGVEYSYDIHGNVDTLLNIAMANTLLENFGCNAYKYIAYKYDLISGKVNEVHYNAGFADEFYHRYEYDADNRLTDVYTTDNKVLLHQPGLEEHDAHYEYYKHGPLARTVLGQQQVQGVDYAYTLQGWLKGVNSITLQANYDMGEDGKAGSVNKLVARDALGFNLNYYAGDYLSINQGNLPFPGSSAALGTRARPLYNGNISSMAVNIGKFNQPQLYNYKYDQLNRIRQMQANRGLDVVNNNWNSLDSTLDYREYVTYDGNGNIQNYIRNGAGAIPQMDKLSYHYYPNTNQLNYVTDEPTYTSNYAVDIDNQSAGNFRYDRIGNMTHDEQGGVDSVEWNVYGKIAVIARKNLGPDQVGAIHYFYDPSGNRVGKKVYMYVHPGYQAKYTWYVRDAQGNVMAVYDAIYDDSWNLKPLRLREHHVYGSSRLAVISRDHNMDSAKTIPVHEDLINNTYLANTLRGEKVYELTNHLGNVLATISDKKTGVDVGNDGIVDYYEADVINANDYYPFGMMMPGRSYSAESGYRYGFNGKENDNEVKGEGNQQDYGMRMYDPRIGKFLSVDPLTGSYPWYTPYQFAGNKPIRYIDLDGAEEAEPGKTRWGTYTDGPGDFDPKTKGYGLALQTPPNPLEKDALLKGTVAAVKATAVAVGAGTEVLANGFHSDQFKDKKNQFPLTGGNPIELARQTLVAPAALAIKVRDHYDEPETWGEVAVFMGILKFSPTPKGAAPDIALGVNNPVPMGPPRSLIRFANDQGAFMHKDWPENFGNLAKEQFTDVSFGDVFTRVMDHVVNNKGNAKFDLTDFSIARAAKDAGKSALESESVTNFEFNSIMKNEKYLKATSFYRNGKSVPKEQVVKEYQKEVMNTNKK